MSRAENLSSYRKEQSEINLGLVKRCIDYMLENDIRISLSSVSDLSFRIAKSENREKGLTAAALSKNQIYRALIKEAEARLFVKSDKTNYKAPLGEAEARLEIYKLKSQLAELKQENIILKHNLANTNQYVQNSIPTVEPEQSNLKQENNELKLALEGVIEVLSKRKLAVMDVDNHIFKLSPPMGDTLIRGETLRKLKVFKNDKNSK
jgi:hypothetical protein